MTTGSTISSSGRRAAAVAAVIAAGCGGGGGPSTPKAAPPLRSVSTGRCPEPAPERLPADAVAHATRAALAEAPGLYRGTKLAGMRVVEAVLATADGQGRGGYPRVKCGRRVQRRTVVVYLDFPAMRPSASLSQGVVLVSRFAGEYRVWAQLH